LSLSIYNPNPVDISVSQHSIVAANIFKHELEVCCRFAAYALPFCCKHFTMREMFAACLLQAIFTYTSMAKWKLASNIAQTCCKHYRKHVSNIAQTCCRHFRKHALNIAQICFNFASNFPQTCFKHCSNLLQTLPQACCMLERLLYIHTKKRLYT